MRCQICQTNDCACGGAVQLRYPPLGDTMARNRQQALWTADRRLYLNAAGQVVEADDPTRASLLVAVGNSIPMAEAIRLGLAEAPAVTDQDEAAVEGKLRRGKGPQDKSRTTGENKG